MVLVADNNRFVHAGDEITFSEVNEYIKLHQEKHARWKELQNQYNSTPPILFEDVKESWKPDNRLVVNNGKYIVDTFTGYFSGIPVKVSHEDENINASLNDFWRHNNMDDNVNELARLTSIYGLAFLFMWQDEESRTRVTYNDPFDMFVIYEDTIEQKAKYGVRYTDEGYGKITGTLYSATEIIEFDAGFTDRRPHYYKRVPIIEFVENDERHSLIRPVETLINAYNKAISEKANDTDYFADAYLAILGAELDEEGTYKIRDNRIINMYGTDDASKIIVKFLDKPDGDVTQENLLNRLETLIHQTSMIPNINDESFGTSSGVALEFKLQPMKNLAATKERKFVRGLNELMQCFMNIPTNVSNPDEWINVHYRFTRNIPRNIPDEARVARELDGVVSRETQLSVLSIVDNVKEEIAMIDEERYSDDYRIEGSDDTWTTSQDER